MKAKLIKVTLLKTQDISSRTQYKITKIVNAVAVKFAERNAELEVGDQMDAKLATELSEQRNVEVTVVA